MGLIRYRALMRLDNKVMLTRSLMPELDKQQQVKKGEKSGILYWLMSPLEKRWSLFQRPMYDYNDLSLSH